jgi:hypothetical protein
MVAWIRNAEMFGAARCTFESNFPVDKGSFGYAVGLERDEAQRRWRLRRGEGRPVLAQRRPLLPAAGHRLIRARPIHKEPPPG